MIVFLKSFKNPNHANSFCEGVQATTAKLASHAEPPQTGECRFHMDWNGQEKWDVYLITGEWSGELDGSVTEDFTKPMKGLDDWYAVPWAMTRLRRQELGLENSN